MLISSHISLFFFFNDTATTEIYTLSLHDALPICSDQLTSTRRLHLSESSVACRLTDPLDLVISDRPLKAPEPAEAEPGALRDRKSTRLNSSHDQISYAVFCLKKKKTPVVTTSDAV